jgi:hypothetical protein
MKYNKARLNDFIHDQDYNSLQQRRVHLAVHEVVHDDLG